MGRPRTDGPNSPKQPSSRHLVIGDIAVVGALVAGYLALYEVGISSNVWDPLFGDGSKQVLTSSFARALPVPDAVLGFVAYVLEAALAYAIGFGFARRTGPVGIVLALVVLGLAAGG